MIPNINNLTLLGKQVLYKYNSLVDWLKSKNKHVNYATSIIVEKIDNEKYDFGIVINNPTKASMIIENVFFKWCEDFKKKYSFINQIGMTIPSYKPTNKYFIINNELNDI